MIFYKENRSFSRRLFLSCLGFFALLRSRGLGFLAEPEKPFKQTWACTFKSSESLPSSVEEYWEINRDEIAYELNAVFRKNGWLIKDASNFSNDSKSVLLTKEFKSKAYCDMYSYLWNKFSRGDRKEARNVKYLASNSHLF